MAKEKKTRKKPKFLTEFKEFALKGNVMSLAVGVIIGGAFQGIVTSLTENLIKPLIAVFTGGVKLDEAGNPQYIGGSFTINGVEFNYGAFLSAVINFIIMAMILFLLVKCVNKIVSLGHKIQKDDEEEKAEETEKTENTEKTEKEEKTETMEKETSASAASAENDAQIALLTEIRDLLKNNKES